MERQFNACQTPRSMYLSIFNSFRVIRCLTQCGSPKIAILPHFCFPWGNHAKWCMDGKKIRCLQIVSMNVPIYLTVCETERDICEKILILSYPLNPLHSTPPLGGFPSECLHPLWYGKTRMVSLPDGEKKSKICLFVLTWSTNVTDGHCVTAPRLCIASRGKK